MTVSSGKSQSIELGGQTGWGVTESLPCGPASRQCLQCWSLGV